MAYIQKYNDFLNESSTFKSKRKELNKLIKKLDKMDKSNDDYHSLKDKIDNLKRHIGNEHKNGNDYTVGDEVLIRYDVTGDIVPVKIVKITFYY